MSACTVCGSNGCACVPVHPREKARQLLAAESARRNDEAAQGERVEETEPVKPTPSFVLNKILDLLGGLEAEEAERVFLAVGTFKGWR